MHSPDEILEVATRAAHAGGDIVKHYFENGVTIESKDPDAAHNLVSQADIESERAIGELILEAFPNHSILGEETHRDDVRSEDLWVVDPLDGTTNFAHGIPHFAISVAYYQGGTAQCGVILNPIRDDTFVAQRSKGATHNGNRVQVSPATHIRDTLIGVGFYYDRGAMMEATLAAVRDLFHQQIHGIRRFGTASLDLAQVGCGLFGGYFEYQLSPWDFAAGRLFVEEAGGRVTDCSGGPLPLVCTTLLASNGGLHDALIEIVKKHRPDNSNGNPSMNLEE